MLAYYNYLTTECCHTASSHFFKDINVLFVLFILKTFDNYMKHLTYNVFTNIYASSDKCAKNKHLF